MSADKKRIVELFIKISSDGKKLRKNSLIFFLIILAAGIYGAVKINIFILSAPIILFILLRPYINPLHEKSIAKYLVKNKENLHPALIKKVQNLDKPTKLEYCREALMTEIRSNLRQKNLLPPDEEK